MRTSSKSGPLRGLAAAAVALAVVFTPVTGAEAATTTKKVGGGLWEYGVEGNVFSYYHHKTKYHSATACNNGMFDQCRKVSSAPNKWAKATKAASWAGGNTAYWDTY